MALLTCCFLCAILSARGLHMWGTLELKYQRTIDGEDVSDALFDEIAHAPENVFSDGGFDSFRMRCGVRVIAFRIVLQDGTETTAKTFAEFTHLCHARGIDYLFVYDGVRDICALQWCCMTDKRGFRATCRAEHIDERTGRYKKVCGNYYAELSGDLGQRYSFDIWSVERRTRAEGGDRHERTHGTTIYAFKNFFAGGVSAVAHSFSVPYDGDDARALYACIERFDALCVEHMGICFLGAKKSVAITAGGLAKRELMEVYAGKGDYKQNVRAFRRAHPITLELDTELRRMRLLRGGVLCVNPQYSRVPLSDVDGQPLTKYDVNSEYLHVAANMPDLVGRPKIVPADKALQGREGFVYIYVFSRFEMRAKRGFPHVFQSPVTGRNSEKICILDNFAIFDFELHALERFYNVGECVMDYAIEVRAEQTDKYRNFAEKWYKIKSDARAVKDTARAEFAKLFINSALGKLSQRSEFVVVRHEVRDGVMVVEKSRNERTRGASLLSVIQGAYINAAGRVYIMDMILKVCGEKNPNEKFVFSATDSVHAFADAPAEIVDPLRLGALKCECRAISSYYDGTAAYYNIRGVAPLDVDFHARGVPFDSVAAELCAAWGVEQFEELPPDALPAIFADEYFRVPCPILANVNGGRATIYTARTLHAPRIAVRNGRKVRREVVGIGGELVEA